MSRVRVYAVALAVLVLFVPFARAAPANRFDAAIAPNAVQPLGIGTYAVAITNLPNSSNASEAHITIPNGFVVGAPEASIISGPCAGPTWTATLGVTSIDVTAPHPSADLCDRGTLAVTFSILVAPPPGKYTWPTELLRGGAGFTAQSQPVLTIDGTPPTGSLDINSGASFTTSTGVTLNLSATDDASGIVSYRVANGGDCTGSDFVSSFGPVSSYSANVAYGLPSGDGSKTVCVQYKDAAGNFSTTKTKSITLDTTGPTGLLHINGGGSTTGSTSVTLNLSATDPNGIVSYRVGNGSNCSSAVFVAPFTAANPYEANVSHTLVAGDGSKTVCAQFKDAAGNVSITYTAGIILHSASPVVTLTSKPPAITNQTTASFNFSSDKPGSSFACKLDNLVPSPCSNTSPVLYTGLDDGSHTFSVEATYLGHTGTTGYSWTVDTVAPDTTITSAPPASSSSASANFTFTGSEVGSTFVCSLDAGGIVPCASPQSYAGLGDGAHSFHVQAVDAAGNADATPATLSWQIAGVGPETTDRTPPGSVKRLKRTVGYRSLKLSWTRPSDSDFDHIEVFASTSVKSLPRTPVYKGRADRYTNKRFKNGLYYKYVVVSYDHAGNASRGTGAVVPPSILLRSPREAHRVHGPPLLVWARVAKATYYNVQLYYGSQKVLSAWPSTAKRKLSRRWLYGGRHFQLREGLYRWYVWPGFGPRSKVRYGQLLGQSTFRVR
jgi:hypothetical protein